MIIDSSVVVAILLREGGSDHFAVKIADAWPRRMSVASLLESTMVVEGKGRIIGQLRSRCPFGNI